MAFLIPVALGGAFGTAGAIAGGALMGALSKGPVFKNMLVGGATAGIGSAVGGSLSNALYGSMGSTILNSSIPGLATLAGSGVLGPLGAGVASYMNQKAHSKMLKAKQAGANQQTIQDTIQSLEAMAKVSMDDIMEKRRRSMDSIKQRALQEGIYSGDPRADKSKNRTARKGINIFNYQNFRRDLAMGNTPFNKITVAKVA